MPNPDSHSAPTSDEIARRAYSLFVARGCAHGHDLDDWLKAEAELLNQRPPLVPKKRTDRRRVPR